MTGANEPITTPWDDDPLHYAAFIGCVRWALSEEKIIEQYRSETGDRFIPAASGFSRMIDQATGADRAFFQRFSDWVAENIYGTPETVFGADTSEQARAV